MAGNKIKVNMLGGQLPNMSTTLNGWEVSILADYVKQEWVNGEITNISYTKAIQGVLQPLKPEDIELKPEGERNWNWNQIHVKSGYDLLRVAQIVKINNIPYKIMAVKNYELYGYVEYHAIRDYN